MGFSLKEPMTTTAAATRSAAQRCRALPPYRRVEGKPHRGPIRRAILSSKYTDQETGLQYSIFRYYHPEMGRWLSRDPMGEADGGGIYCFTANDSVNAVDWLGLLAISAVLDTDGHHASVETDSSVWISYISNKATPGSYQESHAGISTVFLSFPSGVFASIDAWTHQKGFPWPTSYFQMSNGIDGRMKVCGCCPDGKVWVSWTVSAEIRTSGYVPKKGVQGAQATFDAHPATTASSASVRTHGGYGNDDPPVTVSGAGLYFLTPGTCLEFPMHLGHGWYEQDRTAFGVKASSWIVATAECLLGF